MKDISGSFRWAPFLALQSSDTFLTMLLLLSKYRMKSLPVVDIGEGTISNVITQGAVVHMLSECVGLHWFEEWGTKTLSEIGLPIMRLSKIVKVHIPDSDPLFSGCKNGVPRLPVDDPGGENLQVREDEPALKAFRLMRRKGVGGIPVVDDSGRAVGSIMIKDVKHLLTASDANRDYRSDMNGLHWQHYHF